MARAALLLALPVLFLSFFFLNPLARMLDGATADGWAWLASPYVQERLQTAVTQAVLSVAATFALAVPLAWFHHSRRLPMSRVHLAIHAAPFVLPVFVIVYGIEELLGPRSALAGATGLDAMAWLGPLGAIVVAHAYYNYGFAARLLHAALEARPHRLEAAAASLGATPRQAFWRVTVPLLAPAVAGVALLVFLFAFTSFGVVLLLGQGQVATLETLLYQNLQGAFPRPERAAALGLVQLGLNVLLLGGYLALRRRIAVPRETPPTPPPARQRDHVVAWTTLALGLAPAAAVLAGGFRVRGEWTLEPWRALLDPGHPGHLPGFHLGEAVGLSLLYAAASAGLALLLTLLLAYGVRRIGGPWRRLAEMLAALPLGTSSLLVGFGFLLAFGAQGWPDLRGTRVLIVLAHALVGFPFTARVLLPALDSLDRRLDDAAASLGAPPWSVAWHVHAPLLRAPVVAAAGLAVAMSLGDFGASVLLMRQENMALNVWITQHHVPFRSLLLAQRTALAGLLGVLAALAYVAVERVRPKGAEF
ncbi:MAG: ABC transporter permease [Thermoplasmatota archaeon]